MALDAEKYNEAVKQFGAATTGKLKNTGRRLGITHRSNSPSTSESLERIRDRYGNDSSGVINRVSFANINRSLIYTSVGAGNGIGGRKGSRWIDKNGNRRRTDPESLNKLGTGNRVAKPFIDQTLDGPEGVEKLADIVSEYQADAIIESVYLK